MNACVAAFIPHRFSLFHGGWNFLLPLIAGVRGTIKGFVGISITMLIEVKQAVALCEPAANLDDS